METRELALEYTRRALDRFEEPGVSVSCLLRMCLRVASLREDALGLAVLRIEAEDLQTPKSGRVLFPERVQGLSAYLPREKAHLELYQASEANIARRAMPSNPDQIWGGSVASLEESIADIDRNVSNLLLADGQQSGPDNERIRLMLQNNRLDRLQLLERTKAFLFDYLLAAEAELERGQTYSTVFEQTRRYVDESLTQISPRTAEEFRASEQRLLEGTLPAISQALGSCRRALKTLADTVYPAPSGPVTGIDGKKRALGDDQYINRLLQFAAEQTGSRTMSDVLQSGLDALGRRLNSTSALASKGVHANVPLEEAHACFAQTYLLAAEILRLRDRSSTRLDDEGRAHQQPF